MDQLQLLGSNGSNLLSFGMETELLRMILPEGLLDCFDIEDIDRGNEKDGKPFIRIHLTEKNTPRNVAKPPVNTIYLPEN